MHGGDTPQGIASPHYKGEGVLAIHLQEQVQRLEESVKDLKPQLGRTEKLAEGLKRQVELFEGGLQGDRRRVARVLNHVRENTAATAARSGARLSDPAARFGLSWRRERI